ncbi:ABC transporter permease subunit [Marinomonas mediterranea]|jgi:amino acid ABC transporter membrane protein, PAAT family (TC 3.A.1.3.-)|uniref:Putative glutamine transport system permease protein GlnP n=1 Tax=Marinomonas mediterranea (strain ATCC 700492 / JCM 21426 / NBRC 103028 / MMB-1) TaxID=717774 RepID=F2JYK7_MARM1|nr:amino acid ABC transporter permease [Marinomonas mediterranea]ADZ93136.1 polar amino acid ABC transporter, inner membrane subunit [Marinomonas mediterranea MMB-1]WCN15102.1 ABC transporter permease subunit [Marinomonas mediterranea]WCN19145.1 ABC transporter permease subunit [Marinomonas mediterranea MMB-1]
MQSQSSRWLGHGLYLLIMAVLISGVYVSGQRINYTWHWERLWPYIVNTAPQDIIADTDGTVVVDQQGKLSITPDYGGDPQVVTDYTTLVAFDGDLIFQGDTLARLEGWRFGPIAEGLWVTIKISFISLIFSIILGLIFGLMRISHRQVLRNLAVTYVEVIRGTPLLVQIFIVYFFIGTVFDLDRFTAGVAALSIFTGAYVAEIVRAGIQAVPTGQMEAARSLGMNYVQAMCYVVMPQAIKRTLPPLAGQFINLIKDSSLVSVISITDLTKAGREVVSGSFAPFEVWFTVAALYLVVTGALSWAIQILEQRLSASD